MVEAKEKGGTEVLTQDQIDDWVKSESYYNNEEDAFVYRKSVGEMVGEFIKTSGQDPKPQTYFTLAEEEYNEWVETDQRTEEELKELADLVYVLYGYAISLGWNLDEAIRRVHENNMGRMYQPDGTIKRRADGKIEKNKSYPKVNLEDLV